MSSSLIACRTPLLDICRLYAIYFHYIYISTSCAPYLESIRSRINIQNTNTPTHFGTGKTDRSDMSSKINIIQANIQHSITGFAALRRTLEEQPNTIALVQEPYIVRGRVGFNALRGNVFTPPVQNKTRTLIYVPNALKASLVTHLCTDDLTVVKIETGLEGKLNTILIASVYMDGGIDTPPQELEELILYCNTHKTDCIVGCDANAHSTVWGCPNTNDRGKDLLDFILRYNLSILNRGSEPTFVTSWARTIVDITIATETIAEHINNWHVATNEASCADHRRIRFNLETGEIKPRTYRNPKKTDTNIFVELLNKALDALPRTEPTAKLTPLEIEKELTSLVSNVMTSFERSCPLKTESNKIAHRKDKWWNNDLTKLRKKVRHHFNRAMNTNNDEDWRDYKVARQNLKHEIGRSRNNSWKRYSSSIASQSETARLSKILSKDTKIKLGSLKKPDGSYTASEQEQFELLLKTHFPDCTMSENTNWKTHDDHTPQKADWELAESIVTEEALVWAVRTFQPYKAAGTDGIFPALLQWNLSKIEATLTAIYRSCIAWKYIPHSWREVKVVFLPKPGKSDYTQPKSFRPISLSSFLLKTLERLCDRHIRSGPLVANPVNKNQHAYQSGKSTETALHHVVHKIESALESKQSCLVTFIDIEGAFDKTTFSSIEKGLRNQGVNENLNTWITQMLANRSALTDSSEVTRCRVTKGCPQGGVLSPLLWVLVANELLDTLNKDGILTIAYADDLAIMISGLFESTLCEKMQKALRIVEAWCLKHSLSVNPNKTELVLFTRKLKLPKLVLPSLCGKELAFSKEVKYLGIWLDSKLNWSKQLDHATTKATNVLWQCTRAVGKDWGLKPKLCLWMYTVMVRPVLTYGAVVWWPRTNLITAVNKLQQIQRMACSLISGCAKSTPSAALDIILGLIPLHVHIQQEAMAAALRIKSTNQWKGNVNTTNHCKILDKAITIIPEATRGTDRIATTYLTNKRYQIATQEVTKGKDPLTPSALHIYTDGAKNNTGAGCGFYCPETGLSRAQALNKTTTAFQAETIGLLLAATEILPSTETISSENPPTQLIFTTDSASLINALGRPDTRSKSVVECHNALQKLAEKHTVTIRWTRGHGNCPDNDKADSLAKEGAKLTPTPDDISLSSPTTAEIKNRLKLNSEKEHQKIWDQRPDCKHTKTLLPTKNRKITNTLLKMKRDDLRMMVGIITGHCDLNHHLLKTGATDSGLCRGCLQVEETVEHVVIHCTATNEVRSKTGLQELMNSCDPSSLTDKRSGTLEHCCHQPRVLLRYFKELGWLGSG